MNLEFSTIAAIATPQGSGGIGIVRVSGPAAANILTTLFRTPGTASRLQAGGLVSHRMYYGSIVDPSKNTLIDQVLAVFMRAPRSYTAEDVAEIQCHAGHVVLKRILALVLDQGARLAEPGEFTRRAFLNGRIDLTQAEAVADVINAKTEISLAIAGGQLQGTLGNQIGTVRKCLLDLIAEIEADIDFPEDSEDTLDRNRMVAALKTDVWRPLERLVKGYEQRHFFRDGLKMAIVGRPNVGKSSLLNRMIRRDRAIVTEIPGTTRDSIEEMIDIDGLPVVIIDTAGLHATSQAIERLGIARTYAAIEAADVILFVVDASQGITAEDRDIYATIGGKAHILVQNKVDIEANSALPANWEGIHMVRVSALHNTNIEGLRRAIYQLGVGNAGGGAAHAMIPNLRQAQGLKNALGSVKNASAMLRTGAEVELAVMDLKAAAGEMDLILGLRCDEDVLDIIFSRFCIGK